MRERRLSARIHSKSGGLVMRLSNRDLIAWTLAMAIAVAVGGYYYAQQQNASPSGYVYKILVTP
jgi:uncharacterized protein HemX